MMVKLYWRVKKNGKWTWTPAEVQSQDASIAVVLKESVYKYIDEEEEE